MRALQTEISNALYTPIAVIERKGLYFNSPFHYHPELELIYVKKGNGRRIIGDKLDTFATGEVFFVGPNLPHEWKNEDELSNISHTVAHSIVVYFNKEVFSKSFYDLKESNKINALIKKASRGIKVTGATREAIAEKMEDITRKKDFERIIGLMEILHLLSVSHDLEYLVYEGYEGTVCQNNCERLTSVFQFVTSNFSQDITLEEIARVVHLTPPAFCRLFKQKTNRSFFSYLNEVRISNACKFLTETGYNISEVAFNCGYKTLSNFNKFFKSLPACRQKHIAKKCLPDLIDLLLQGKSYQQDLRKIC